MTLDRIYKFYNKKYSRVEDDLYGGDDTELRRWELETDWKALNLAGLVPDADSQKLGAMLEIGCATGLVMSKVSKVLGPGISIGVDISPGNIKTAKKRGSHGKYVVATGEYLPFRDGSFDIVILSDVLEHIEEPGRIQQEVKRTATNSLINVPLEKCLKNSLFSKEYGLDVHIEGHLRAWGEKDVIKILENEGMTVLSKKTLAQPDEIRWYSMKYYSSWFVNSPFRPLITSMEKALYHFGGRLHKKIFGSFLFCYTKNK